MDGKYDTHLGRYAWRPTSAYTIYINVLYEVWESIMKLNLLATNGDSSVNAQRTKVEKNEVLAFEAMAKSLFGIYHLVIEPVCHLEKHQDFKFGKSSCLSSLHRPFVLAMFQKKM